MSVPLELNPQADRDVTRAFRWYQNKRLGLGFEFLERLETVLNHLRDWPESYAEEPRGVRRARLKQFPYIVIYRYRHGEVRVIAVLHSARHDRVWKRRL